MSFQEFILLITSVLASATGQFFLKVGALKLGKVTGSNLLVHVLSIVTIPELIGGLACYGIGAIAYILLLTRVQLSVAGPAVALTYVFSIMIGYFIFREVIPIYRLFGMGFIICGVILLVWQKS